MNLLRYAITTNGLAKRLVLSAVLIASSVCTLLTPVNAAEATEADVAGKQIWAISMDNDLFVPFASSDRDFTGGMALTYSGAKGVGNWRHLDNMLGSVDSAFNAGELDSGAVIPSIEFGFYGFTPDDVQQDSVRQNDRPYASLVYLSISRQYPIRGNGNSISTSLTLGVLGSDIVGDVQNELHRAVGNDEVRGWRNQISDGGELTARYQIAYHDYWQNSTFDSRFKTTYFSSIGYLTEVGVALSTRQGLISSPDNRFHPELISYGERVNQTVATPYQGEESYFWGGVGIKGRLYNVFLQGQLRASAHSLDYEDLRPLVAEAWAGYTFTIGREFKASYLLRAQSSELKGGEGDRGHVWGGIVLSRYF